MECSFVRIEMVSVVRLSELEREVSTLPNGSYMTHEPYALVPLCHAGTSQHVNLRLFLKKQEHGQTLVILFYFLRVL